MLRLTCDDLLVGLVRFGLLLVDTGVHERPFRPLRTGFINVAARRIPGIGRSPRIPLLHLVAGVVTPLNPYILGCAQGLDGALRPQSSPLCIQLRGSLARECVVAVGGRDDVLMHCGCHWPVPSSSDLRYYGT